MHTISAILPSIYKNLLILVEIWRHSCRGGAACHRRIGGNRPVITMDH